MRSPKTLRLTPLARAFSVVASCLFASSSAHAIDWRFKPYVGSAITYTDNVNQTTQGQNAFILRVTPGFSLNSEGSRRVKASMSYSLSAASRFGEDNSNDLYHNLGAVGTAELVEDFLFIDGTASISQGLISIFGSQTDATTNDANRTSVGVYSISPYIKKRFGNFAIGEARYTTGGAIFGKNSASDSVTNRFTASLDSGTQFNDFSWGLDYLIYRSDYSGATTNTTFERASVQLGYALTRKFRVFGTYGEEWNDYLSTRNASGSYYSVGFGWSPSRRTSIEATVGERYFGRTYSFTGRHKTRATDWRVSYSEDISDISQLVLNRNDLRGGLYICTDPSLLPPNPTLAQIIATPGCRVTGLYFGTSVQNGVFIAKLLSADVTWTKGRWGLGLSVYDTKRLYQDLRGAEDNIRGVTGTVSYRMTPQTSANGSLSFIRNSATAILIGTPDRSDNIVNLDLGLSHKFSRDLSGALSFRHTQRDSNAFNSDYTENSLTASANLSF